MRLRPSLLVRWSISATLALLCLAGPFAPQAQAQSDAATASATVTVEEASISVTTIHDLEFGTHFPSSGFVISSAPARWEVDVAEPLSVDLQLTQLPSFLTSEAGDQVPLSYGASSLSAACDGNPVGGDPAVGLLDCIVNPPVPGIGNVALGNAAVAGDISDEVQVDLTGAPAGTYTATIELTATVN